jgi:DNA-directed RNA polymerase specialized sigma24 family protein
VWLNSSLSNGDPTSNENSSPELADYHNWLYKTAADFLPGGYQDKEIDDLVQEGRIAMWKAYEKYDEAKGTLAPWITNAARSRMKDIAHGHGRWTGHTGRRGVTDAMSPHVPRPLALDILLEDWEFDELRLRSPVAASKVMTASNVRAWANG